MMKNFLLSLIITFLLGNLCRFGLPWWSLAPMAAIVAWFLPQTGIRAFLTGLLAGMLLWGISALMLDVANSSVFSAKIGQVFQGLSSAQLLLATALMGGLLGGFGALTGQWARDLGSQPKRRDYYTRRKRSGSYR